MSWITATVLMMFVSVAMYTFVRFTKKHSIPPILNTFAMISLPVPIYTVALLFIGTDYTLKATDLLVMILQGIILIYFGNLYALRGIEAAPNPGYSVLISKLYVVFTAPASILLFNAPLSFRSVVGILVILFFSYFVIVEKKLPHKNASGAWVLSTLIAFLCFGGIALSSKYLLDNGVPIILRLLIPGILASLLYLPAAKQAYQKIEMNRAQLQLLVAIALCSIGFNYFMQYAFAKSTNVGLVNAANAASTALLAVTSAVLFHDHLSKKKVVGIAGVLIGLYLLFL